MFDATFVVLSGNSMTGADVIQILAGDSNSGVRYKIDSIDYVHGAEVVLGSWNTTIRSAFLIDQSSGRVSHMCLP